MPLLLLPNSLLGLANFLYRRHDATVRSARRTSENPVSGTPTSEKTPSRQSGEQGHRRRAGVATLRPEWSYRCLLLSAAWSSRGQPPYPRCPTLLHAAG